MIFEYDKKTGVIFNGISSRELKKGMGSVYESKPQREFYDSRGNPVKLKNTRDVFFVRDSDISLKYLFYLRDESGFPNFKFILKDGKPIKIVPINGTYPEGWHKIGASLSQE